MAILYITHCSVGLRSHLHCIPSLILHHSTHSPFPAAYDLYMAAPLPCAFCESTTGWAFKHHGHVPGCVDEDNVFDSRDPLSLGEGGLDYLAFSRRFPSLIAEDRERDDNIIAERGGLKRELDKHEILMRGDGKWTKLFDERVHALRMNMRDCPFGSQLEEICQSTANHLALYHLELPIVSEHTTLRSASWSPQGFPQSRCTDGSYWWTKKNAPTYKFGQNRWVIEIHPFFWTEQAIKYDLGRRHSGKGDDLLEDELKQMRDDYDRHKEGLRLFLGLFSWSKQPNTSPSGLKPDLFSIFTFNFMDRSPSWARSWAVATRWWHKYWWSTKPLIEREDCNDKYSWLYEIHPIYWSQNMVNFYHKIVGYYEDPKEELDRLSKSTTDFCNSRQMLQEVANAQRLSYSDRMSTDVQELLLWVPWDYGSQDHIQGSRAHATAETSAGRTSMAGPSSSSSGTKRAIGSPGSEPGPSFGRRKG